MIKKYLFIFAIINICLCGYNIATNETSKYTLIQKNKDELLVEVAISEINLEEILINNTEFNSISLPNSYPSTKYGAPNLPYLNKLIEIPHESNIKINIIEVDIEEYNLNNYNINKILPVQPHVSKSDKNPIKDLYINNDIYLKNEFYKQELIKIETKGFLREVQIGNIMISPIEYHPIENKILVYKNIKFEIIFENSNHELTNNKQQSTFSPYFQQVFSSTLDNYNVPPLTRSRNNDFIDNEITYLIISDQIFEDSLEPFIDWKTEKGYNVIVAYTNEIGSSSNAIKNYISNQYNNPPNNNAPPSFVLLVGDTQQIPASYSSGGHVSDLDYCDYTNDNLPEVLCGRFSAQNPTQLNAQISKTIEYEKYDMPDPSFLANVLMISGVDANYAPTYGNGQINYGNNYYFNSNNNINSTTYLYPASSNAELQILNTANNGVGFINYTAHGYENGWADPEFNNTDANNMSNNHKYPTMIGNCCLTNAFDSGSCFGETLLRKSGGGAIGYIGGSDVTYWDEDFWWGVGAGNISSNPSYNNTGEGTYDGMFHENNESNWATVNSAIMMLGNLAVAEANGMDDYYWEIYHLMGDPSISTYFGIPSTNNVSFNPFLPIGSEAIEIQADPFSYVGLSHNGNLISSGTVEESGFLVLVFDPISEPGTLDLVITAQNTQPYFNEIFVASPDGSYITVNNLNINTGDDDIISFEEIININMILENVGNETANNINVSLNNINNNPYIQILNGSNSINQINEGETVNTDLSFLISNEAPYGHLFILDINLETEDTEWNQTLNLNVENLIESFETAALDNMLWQNSGDIEWEVILGGSEGNYSAKSGLINHNMSSELSIEMEIVEAGNISFDKKVSCEDVGSQTGNYYDYLAFYIDGQEMGKWAGEIDWSQNSYEVSEGQHTFLWKYIKDQGVTTSDDAAWIDNIIFPPTYYNSILLGDANYDGYINIQDVIVTVGVILNSTEFNAACDFNEDGTIDVIDVIGIVNIILN